MNAFRIEAFTLVAFLLCSACAPTGANGPAVEVLPAPLPGYVCFGITDNAGNRVGGNCEKE